MEHGGGKIQYVAARSNLLLVALFTAINIFLLASNSYTYFLFSATIPYVLPDFAMFYCGMYPDEVYTGELAGMEFFHAGVFWVALAISVVIIALYVLAFLFSNKNRVGWLIFSLVFFAIDTVFMFLYIGISADSVIDLIFHAWIIVILAMGIHAHFKLRAMEGDNAGAIVLSAADGESDASEYAAIGSSPIRAADLSAPSKIILELPVLGRRGVYRRVGKTNELVIDGYVYGEYQGFFEKAHSMAVNIGECELVVGYDGATSCYVIFNGELVARRLRRV